MKTLYENEEADIQVELIPLLDVVFCLLAVFILATVGLSRPDAINLNLPKAETSTPQFSGKFKVQVGLKGGILANNQPVNQNQLKQLVGRYLQTNPRGVVILKADGSATYEQVINVLDMLRSVGGERVALETTKGDPASPSGLDSGNNPQESGQEPSVLPVPADPGSGVLPPDLNQPGLPPGLSPGLPNQPALPNQPTSPLPGQSPLPRVPGSQPNPATP